MRALALIFLVAIMHLGLVSYGQKITLLLKNERLETVFKEVRKQSRYDFLYNEALIKDLKPVNIDVKNVSVESVLDSLLLTSDLKYSIQDKLVMISRKDMVAESQESFTISGIVKDKEGRPMPGAGILLSNYKKGAVAGDDGRFKIAGLKPGNYNVLVEMMGYQPASNNVLITNRSEEIEFILSENARLLKEVAIYADPNRSKFLKIFKRTFIGTSPNANDCVIVNPEVLFLEYDYQNQILKVSADELLVIENKALGYRIKYLLKYYERDEQTNVVVFYGYPFFEELEALDRKRRKYLKKREVAYIGSPQHFFRALYHNKTNEEGFIINDLIKAPNSMKYSEAMLEKKNKLRGGIRLGGSVWTQRDSLAYRALMNKVSDTLEVLVRRDLSGDELVLSSSGPLKFLDTKQALYITFKGEREIGPYLDSGFQIKRPKDLSPFQISIVYQLRGPIGFYENGGLYDPVSLLYEGVWGFEKVGDMVPLDYTLEK